MSRSTPEIKSDLHRVRVALTELLPGRFWGRQTPQPDVAARREALLFREAALMRELNDAKAQPSAR